MRYQVLFLPLVPVVLFIPGSGEAPDIYISTTQNSRPDKTLLVGDWKKSEFEIACTETHGYALTIFEGKYQQQPGCVFFGSRWYSKSL